MKIGALSVKNSIVFLTDDNVFIDWLRPSLWSRNSVPARRELHGFCAGTQGLSMLAVSQHSQSVMTPPFIHNSTRVARLHHPYLHAYILIILLVFRAPRLRSSTPRRVQFNSFIPQHPHVHNLHSFTFPSVLHVSIPPYLHILHLHHTSRSLEH